MKNNNLVNAKSAKNDEFYTQYNDIKKELEVYLEYNANVFRDKIVYCNCDDPYKSNFFRYFVLNFKKFGLKQLLITSYKTANRFIINEIYDFDGDFTFNDIVFQLKKIRQNEWSQLKGDGDFRSFECIDLMKQSDIIVTNPPFSLFREYVKQLFDYEKQFVIIGSMNAITYKEIFPLIQDNKMWLGNGFHAGNAYFYTPNSREFASGVFDSSTDLVKFRNVCWFTNLDHGRRHKHLPLMTMSENFKYSKHKEVRGKEYKKYDNYDAIEVPYTDAIPSDYIGVMGVPISFLEKYSPEQFEIIGTISAPSDPNTLNLGKDYSKYIGYTQDGILNKRMGSTFGKCPVIIMDDSKHPYYEKDGVRVQATYHRIFIKHKNR